MRNCVERKKYGRLSRTFPLFRPISICLLGLIAVRFDIAFNKHILCVYKPVAVAVRLRSTMLYSVQVISSRITHCFLLGKQPPML